MPIRLIALDLDGTLLDNDKQITPATRQALRDAAATGVHVVLASGRMTACITPVAEKLGLDGPIISYNGARVVGPQSEDRSLIWHRPLAAADAAELIDFHETQRVQLNYYLDDKLYSVDDPEMRPLLDLYCRRTGSVPEFVPSLRQFIGRDPTKAILLAENARRDELYQQFKASHGDRMWVVKSDPEYLEFLDPGVNKGVALRSLAEQLQIPIEETMACGDGDNDADMLAAAGLGVAMCNGSDACKTVAGYVTQKTNHEGGVAEAVERFVLSASTPS